MSDDVLRLVGLEEDGGDEEHRRELETILLALKNRKLDDYTAGVLNSRALALLNLRRGRVTVDDVASATSQSRRTFYRRLQLARELAPEQFEDVREEVVARRLTATHALRLVELRQAGHQVPASADALRHVDAARKTQALTAVERARLEGFVEGARWSHRALLQELPTDDWLAALTHDWRESRR